MHCDSPLREPLPGAVKYHLLLSKARFKKAKLIQEEGVPGAVSDDQVKLLRSVQQSLADVDRCNPTNSQLSSRDDMAVEINDELDTLSKQAVQQAVNLLSSNDDSAAYTAFSQALATKKGNRAEIFYMRARCRSTASRAIEDFTSAIQLEPNHQLALFERGCANRKLAVSQLAVGSATAEKFYQAMSDLDRAVQQGHTEAMQQLATVREEYEVQCNYVNVESLVESKELLQAESQCLQVLQVASTHPGALALLVQIKDGLTIVSRHCTATSELFASKELLQADDQCSQALAIFPNYAEAVALHAQITGALAEADRHCATALDNFQTIVNPSLASCNTAVLEVRVRASSL